jgi:hypothetical protein
LDNYTSQVHFQSTDGSTSSGGFRLAGAGRIEDGATVSYAC